MGRQVDVVDVSADGTRQLLGMWPAGSGVLPGEVGHFESVSLGQPQQQFGGQWPLVAFQQSHITWRDAKVIGHNLLRETEFAAQAAWQSQWLAPWIAAHPCLGKA